MNKNTSLFLSPTKVDQYNSHMVMTNVSKPTQKKFLNIDTKYCDEYFHNNADISNNVANYNITLPERIFDVKSIQVLNVEIPMTYFNISRTLGNSYFKVTFPDLGSPITKIIFIPDGVYTIDSLLATINGLCSPRDDFEGYGFSFTRNPANPKQIYINLYPGSYIIIDFSVNPDGVFDKYNFKNKLGWLLGFREPTIQVNGYGSALPPALDTDPRINSYYAQNYYNLTGMKYLYLAIDEYSKGNQDSFKAPIANAIISKNIITKITLDNQAYPFGSILPANTKNGYLMDNKRTYNGKIDLQKINVQLLDENGNVVALNDSDFSFGLEIEYE